MLSILQKYISFFLNIANQHGLRLPAVDSTLAQFVSFFFFCSPKHNINKSQGLVEGTLDLTSYFKTYRLNLYQPNFCGKTILMFCFQRCINICKLIPELAWFQFHINICKLIPELAWFQFHINICKLIPELTSFQFHIFFTVLI